ncbi:MAG TPA: N-6 DNA methylase [Streptosporangiaceae bacterium]|nr:N-6 DNA methylase [Streptosporangiaceae bacterium]
MGDDEHEEMTAAAIARLAGVGRAAVSNWRSRYPDFPEPVGGSPNSPTFSRAEVEGWLRVTGKGGQLATAGRTQTGTELISGVAGSAGELAAGRLRQVERQKPWRSIADLTSGELLARAMASLLPRFSAAVDAPDIADINIPVVLDPACLHATALMAVADRFGDRVRLVGQEIQESAAATAALNLRTSGHGAPYEVHVGDSLLDNQLASYLRAAAGVVCEPPFDAPQWPSIELAADPRWEFGTPAPRDSELAWLQHCYAHLRPQGVAVVAVTPRTCVQPSGEQVRAALVRSGALRDVIALPAGMSSVPGTDVYLWVLQRPYGAPDLTAIRMIDLSGLADAAEVPHEFAAWERLFEDADPAISRAVSRLELLDGGVSLLPSRYVTTRAEASAADLEAVTDRLQAIYARIGQGLPRFEEQRGSTRHYYATVGELERAGALAIRSREATPLPGDLLLRTLGRPPVVATGSASDDVGIAQIIEIDDSRLDAHFVAAFLRADAHALPVANTLGALSRDDVRRCRIPRMPIAEQRRYGDAFRHLQLLADAFTVLAKISTSVIDQTIHGLIAGTLAPELAVMNETVDGHPADDETREL